MKSYIGLHIPDKTSYVYDALGNRTNVNVQNGSDVNYVVDCLTNRYNSVGSNSLTYDEAGNLIVDKDGKLVPSDTK
jgi:hypothetical protein